MDLRVAKPWRALSPLLPQIATAFFALMLFALSIQAILELALILARSSPSDLEALSIDEAAFFEVAHIRNGMYFVSGYGPFFWLLLTAIDRLFPSDIAIVVARTVFWSFKYIGWLWLSLSIQKSNGTAPASLMLFALVATPGYLFFGKIVSPEYQLLLICVAALVLLQKDRWQLKRYYYFALVATICAAGTKLTALPLMGSTLFYVVLAAWLKPQKWRVMAIHAGSSLAIFAFCLVVVLLISGGMTVVEDINAILAIMPDKPSMPFWLAYWRDEMTWDQILVGGIRADFLAVSWLTVTTPLLWWFYRRVLLRTLGLSLVLFVAGVLTYWAPFRMGIAMSWYVFLPFLLLAAAYVYAIPSQRFLPVLMGVVIIAGTLVFGGVDRFMQRIEVKSLNNMRLEQNMETMAHKILPFVDQNLSCARTIYVDIGVPIVPSSLAATSIRLVMNDRLLAKFSTPDLFVVNAATSVSGRAALIEYGVKGHFDEYGLVLIADNLGTYIYPRFERITRQVGYSAHAG